MQTNPTQPLATSRATIRSRRGNRIRTEPGRPAPRRLPQSVAIAAALMLGTPVSLSSAATRTWDGGGTTNNWSNGSNWNGNTDIALDGTDSIVFAAAGASRLTTGVQNLVGLSILGLSYNANAGATVIGGSESLTILGDGITNNTGLAQALNMPIIIGANQTWSSNAALNLGGGISFAQGANGLTLSGNGSYNLTGNIANGSGTSTLSIDGGTLNVSGTSIAVANFNVANAANSTGSFTLLAGKTQTVTSLSLGVATLSNGTYNLAGGSLNVTDLRLGVNNFSTGILNLSSGTLKVTNSIINTPGVSAIYVDGGILDFSGTSIGVENFNIGNAANSVGTFTLLAGQTHTVTNLGLGVGAGSKGTYNLSGGTLNVTNSLSNNAGAGTINIDGGTLNVLGTSITVDNFNVGNAAGATGSFTLGTGKTHTVTNLGLGIGAGSSGTYNLSGGTLNVTNSIVNHAGTGTLNFDRGILSVSGPSIAVDNFNVGNADGSIVRFSLLAGKTHSVANLGLGIGVGSNGTYNLSGGTLNVTNSIANGAGIGTLNIDAGTLDFSGTSITVQNFNIGNTANSTASFALRSGKSHTVTNLGLGVGTGSSGAYNLAGGTLNVTSSIINNAGTGTLNIDGGTLNVAGASIDVDNFNVANAVGSFASFTLAAGKTHTVTNLGIGVGNTAMGTYTLAGGTLNVASSIAKGGGASTFNFDGGTLNVAGGLIAVDNFNVANANGAVASFALPSGKTLAVTNLNLGVGTGSNGTFTLAGGTLNVEGLIANNPGTGTLDINSGTFNFTGTSINVDNFNLGNSAGSGSSFTLRAGKSQTVTNLGLGLGANSNGSYFVQGGTLTVTGSVTKGAGTSYLVIDGGTFNAGLSVEVDNFQVGSAKDATGSFNMLAGTHTVTNLGLGLGANSKGTYTLSGGTLNVGSIAKGSGSSDFHLNGGTLNLGTAMNVNTFHIASAAGNDAAFTLTNGRSINLATLSMAEGFGSKATFRLEGGSLTTEATMIAMNGRGIFEQTGGTHTVMSLRSGLPDEQRTGGTYHLQGGTLNVGAIGIGYPGFGNPNLYINGGTLNLGAGGGINVNSLSIGDMQGRTGSLVIGTQQTLGSGELWLGGSGTGSLTISGGGSAFTSRAFVSGGGTLTVTGSDPLSGVGSSMYLSDYLQVSGPANVEALKIENGGYAWTSRVLLLSGTANVTGANTLLQTYSLEVGWGNGAAANVSAGATVQSTGETWVGINSGISGALSVTGGGSTLISSGTIVLGVSGGAGTLVIGAGGLVSGDQGVQVSSASKVSIGTGGRLITPSLENRGRIEFTGGAATLEANTVAQSGSRILATGNSSAVVNGAVEVQGNAEVQIAPGSMITFTGMVNQRNGAVFSGTGDKVYAGGFAVGNSPGLGLDAGSVTFASTNVYEAEIAGTAPGNAQGLGLMFDRYVVAGKLTFGGTLKVVHFNGFVPQAGQSFDLFDWGTRDGQFSNLDFTAAPLSSGLAWNTSRLYVDGTLSVAAVPEPSGYAMFAAGLGLMGFMVRRRRNATPA